MAAVTIAILFLLGGLAAWQRRLDDAERQKTMADLRESRERGTHQAVSQYPQINPFLCIGCGSCITACPEDGVIGLINGVAHVIHGSHCVGHALCQDACPVGAIAVGLGDLNSRPDIPLLSPEFETSVPGIFIAGELGGLALIRHAVDQGTRAVDVIARRLAHEPAQDPDDLDLVIVGAGPAGLAASLRATEHKLRYQTLSEDDIGGTIRKYPRSKLALVQAVSIPLHGSLEGRDYSKEEMVALWEGLVARYALPVQTGCALLSVSRKGDVFETRTSGGLFRSRALLLALGRRGSPRKLGVPGEDQKKVLYQLIDATSYNHLKILVVGGGDSAIEAATGLANQRGNEVTISYRRESFVRLKPRNAERLRDYLAEGRVNVLFSTRVSSIEPSTVYLQREKNDALPPLQLANDFVFILVGGDPPYPLLQQMGIRFQGSPPEVVSGAAV